MSDTSIVFRPPTAIDGMPVWQLVKRCPPLDPNSVYCNLLQCAHFSATSVAVDVDGQLSGFISAYLIPDRPHTLFVWQVAVGEAARGQGLARRMIEHILSRDTCRDVTHLETTITKDNGASWALFESVARSLKAEMNSEVYFDKTTHFDGEHDSEFLVTIGPFQFQK